MRLFAVLFLVALLFGCGDGGDKGKALAADRDWILTIAYQSDFVYAIAIDPGTGEKENFGFLASIEAFQGYHYDRSILTIYVLLPNAIKALNLETGETETVDIDDTGGFDFRRVCGRL